CTRCEETTKAEAWDRDDLLSFDAILLYDFQREITDPQKARFVAIFYKGVGLIVFHHALLSYQNWPEYERIAGGKYLLDVEKTAGGLTPASTYQGDTDIAVKIADKDHPIARGFSDFVQHDEIYRGVRNTSDIHIIMTAEDKPLVWARQEKNSRVVAMI